MTTPNDHRPPATRDAAFALVPRFLVALAGACTLSGLVGFAMLVAGAGAPPIALLLAPPVLVLLGYPGMVLRADRAASRGRER